MIGQKLGYLIRSVLNQNQVKRCPNCQNKHLRCIDTKYWFTRLYKCQTCKLNFRFPVDSKNYQEKFYQSSYQANYSEITRTITELPSDNELGEMMENNFYGKRDYSPFIKAISKASNARVLDFGCSWGYSVFQLLKAGYEAEGYEISTSRANFGKKIGVTIYDRLDAIKDNYDVIMSSHTIEHLPVISDFIRLSSSKLSENGIFMAFCPNGSPEFRAREPHNFHVNWGLLHPNYLDVEFAVNTFKSNPYLILTDDWRYDFDMLTAWDGYAQTVGRKLDGQELLIIAKPNIEIA